MAGFRDKLQKLINPPEDEYEDYYEDEDEVEEDSYAPEPEPERRSFSFSSYSGRTESRDTRGNGRVVQLNTGKPSGQVSFHQPSSYADDAAMIADDFLRKNTILLNLDNLDKENSRRIADFLAGVAYATKGRFKQVAKNFVVVVPNGVDLNGTEFLDGFGSDSMFF